MNHIRGRVTHASAHMQILSTQTYSRSHSEDLLIKQVFLCVFVCKICACTTMIVVHYNLRTFESEMKYRETAKNN